MAFNSNLGEQKLLIGKRAIKVKTLFLRALILGVTVIPFGLSNSYPVQAQTQSSFAETLRVWEFRFATEFENLCKLIDEQSKRSQVLSKEIDVAKFQIEAAKVKSSELDARLRKLTTLHVQRRQEALAGQEAPLAGQVEGQLSRVRDKSNDVVDFLDEWEGHSKWLETYRNDISDYLNQAKTRKEKTKANLDYVRKTLETLPTGDPTSGTITSDEAEKAKKLEELEKVMSESMRIQIDYLGKAKVLLDHLEIGYTQENMPAKEGAQKLIRVLDGKPATEITTEFQRDVVDLEKNVTALEADVENLNQAQSNEANRSLDVLSGGAQQRVNVAHELPNEPAITVLDEPTSGLDESNTGTPVIGQGEIIKPYFAIFGGINTLGEDNIDLPDFNQFIDTDSGSLIGIEAGLEKQLSNNINLTTSLFLQRSELELDSLGNNLPLAGSLPLGGEIETDSLGALIGVSWDIFKDDKLHFQPWVKVGGGVAFQKLRANNGGINVLSENETTAMATVRAGVDFPLNDIVSFGIGGYVNWFDGFNVTAGPGVTSSFEDRTEIGALLSIKIAPRQLRFAVREGGQTVGHGQQ